ncbi:MAG: orotate phosphoribosyltransferase [Gemmatimonadetes bacterium]|nr:orotate phosphoribosyltransferase [Gemmatimonadota bacterium]MYC69277.1 orotate phosphoribosyltransferase [Gemmatimonadota bacterium]
MTRLELAHRIYQTAHLRGQFTLRSGATATEYFDKYQFETHPELLRALAIHLQPLIPDDTDILAGLELGGVPIATMLAQLSGLSTCFVRKQAKGYGTCKLAEGPDIAGKNLLIVEDVVTSGGQIALSARDLRNLGAEVSQAICVIDRESGGTKSLAREGIELHALFRMSELK